MVITTFFMVVIHAIRFKTCLYILTRYCITPFHLMCQFVTDCTGGCQHHSLRCSQGRQVCYCDKLSIHCFFLPHFEVTVLFQIPEVLQSTRQTGLHWLPVWSNMWPRAQIHWLAQVLRKCWWYVSTLSLATGINCRYCSVGSIYSRTCKRNMIHSSE